MLMGDEVPPRKRFIQSRAKTANLDIWIMNHELCIMHPRAIILNS
jgi:hypothetical protein